MPTISESDFVIVRHEKNLKTFQLNRYRKLWMERSKFTLDAAIGEPYGSSFVCKNGGLVKVNMKEVEADVGIEAEDMEVTRDNRNLVDTGGNQKMSREEIEELRKQGASGQSIVKQLVENSATFKDKNEFAQQKYLKKKTKKHLPLFTILKPNTRLLAEMYYNRGPSKICNLRVDSLAQILTYGNIHAGSKVLVVETCVGLVLGAVMERMAGNGTVVQMYAGSAPVRQALDAFNFPKEFFEMLHSFPLNQVNTLKKVGKPKDGSSAVMVDSQPVTHATPGGSAASPTVPSAPHDTSCGTTGDTGVQPAANDTPDGEAAGSEATDPSASESRCQMPSVTAAADCSSEERTHQQQDNGSTEQGEERGTKRRNQEDLQDRKRLKQEQLDEARTVIEKADMDGLVVVTKFHPTPIVLHLIDYLAPSRPFAVFSSHVEPILDCYQKLRDRGGVVLTKVTETWLRHYQVLPNRTHPSTNMSGGGGYLLTGTTVAE